MATAMSEKAQGFIENVCGQYPRHNYIDPIYYENYNVKRGLRNADNTGVLAGITKIGAVHGAIVEDGERVPIEGKLYYRGYEINDIINGFTGEGRQGFGEVAYLLLYGSLPTRSELDTFEEVMCELRTLPPSFTEDMILKAPSPDVMNKLARCVLALYSYDSNPDDCSLPNMLRQSMQLIAQVAPIVAHAYFTKRHYYNNESLIIHNPQDLPLAENFLQMVRPDQKYTQEEARLLDICLVLHAEHGGGNNSSFTSRVLSSSGTDTYSAISAAVSSLKGPKHGGANIKVMEMFEAIKENVRDWKDDDEISSVLGRIIDKKLGDCSGLVYGMGHAVYTLSDPRAILLKKYAKELAASNSMMPEFELLESVERLTPGVFASVKGGGKIISANVDMYSGLVYQMLNIPTDLFTPLFAIARTVGWCAHRIEEALCGGRIIRPAYRSISAQSVYSPLERR